MHPTANHAKVDVVAHRRVDKEVDFSAGGPQFTVYYGADCGEKVCETTQVRKEGRTVESRFPILVFVRADAHL